MKSILSIIAVIFYGSLSLAQSPEIPRQKTINVTGVAELEITPDEIYVQVVLREYDKKGGGKTDIGDLKSEFLSSLLSIGISETDISVDNYAGWDGNYVWYKKTKRRNPDMKASITYQVKLSSVKKMDELVQKLNDEATENFSIARVSHSKIEELKKQLKSEAIKAAKAKAIYLAEAINEKAGEAITINEPTENQIFPQVAYANKLVMQNEIQSDNDNIIQPNIDFRKMKLRFEVSAVFALK